jgi:hypothetical protein
MMTLPLVDSLMVVSCFLEDYYKKTNSDDLGSLLGLMEIDADGTTMDPAIMGDWEDSVEKALNKKDVTEITSDEAYQAMLCFLDIYIKFTASKDVSDILHELKLDKNNHNIEPMIQKNWYKCWALGIENAQNNPGENLAKHFYNIPGEGKEIAAYALPNGNKVFKSLSQGKKAGYKVVYEKEIDTLGKTIGYKKMTIDPSGAIIQTQDKLKPNGE